MALNRPQPAPLALSIDEIVLDGVAPGDPAVTKALERAITHAMAGRPEALADPGAIAAAAGAAITAMTKGAG
ncbi:MAG: hypothetical protein M3070_18895 [Actinomycetota bacterium]|nr:hypothetical protein [Actinomycetota bacterium]